jgi:hypothetical protein
LAFQKVDDLGEKVIEGHGGPFTRLAAAVVPPYDDTLSPGREEPAVPRRLRVTMAGAVAGKHTLSEPFTMTTTTPQGARLVMWSLGSGGL